MTWLSPKVTWGTELVSDSDLNRIEGNILHLNDNKLGKSEKAADSDKIDGYDSAAMSIWRAEASVDLNDNLDTYVTNGIYVISDSTNVVNKPTGLNGASDSAWGILTVKQASSYLVQEWEQITNSARIWRRVRSEAAWSAWREVMQSTAETTVLYTNPDLCNVNGFYRCAPMSIVPVGYNASDNDFFVHTQKIGGYNYLRQMAYDVRSHKVFTRTCLNGAWQNWFEIPVYGTNPTQWSNINTMDGNNLVMGAGMTGAPDAGWWIVDQKAHNYVWRYQQAISFTAPTMSIKERYMTGVDQQWTSWKDAHYSYKNYGKWKSVSGNYTITDADHGLILYNTTGGGKTIYCPNSLRYDFECAYVENYTAGSYSVFTPSSTTIYSVDSKRTTNKPGSMVYVHTGGVATDICLFGDLRA